MGIIKVYWLMPLLLVGSGKTPGQPVMEEEMKIVSVRVQVRVFDRDRIKSSQLGEKNTTGWSIMHGGEQ